MVFLKKVHEDWNPQENPSLQVGDTVDFPGPYEKLVRRGMAVLVDKEGNELELPGQMFECPVCFESIEGLKGFTDHVSKHLPEGKPIAKASEKETDIRAKRLAALEKARAARAKKREADGKEE